MKLLTKEEEEAHYAATRNGGALGGAIGLSVGLAVVYAAAKRFHTVNSLTLPFKTFLVTSSGTLTAIISADRASRSYESARDPSRKYKDQSSTAAESIEAQKSTFEKAKDWGRENRYPIVTASWVASMGTAFALVSRNKYLTGAQKLVQARVYAQGLTLAVLVATAAFETSDATKGKGRWETVKILDPDDPEHKHMIEKRIHHEAYQGEDLWRDMVATEERKMDLRNKEMHKQEEADKKTKSNSSSSSDSASSGTPPQHPKSSTSTKQSSGKSAKDKIASESKSAGKVDYDEADAKEKKNMAAQTEKESAARDSKMGAVADGAKVQGRNETSGVKDGYKK